MCDRAIQTHDFIEALLDHAHVLGLLQDEGKRHGELNEILDESPRNISRRLSELEAEALVTKCENGGEWHPTLTGELTFNLAQEHERVYEGIAKARSLIGRLPPDSDIDYRILDGADVDIGPEEAPQAPFVPIQEAVEEADHVVGFAPIVMPWYVDVFHEQITEHDMRVELVLGSSTLAATVANHSREWQEALNAANCQFWSREQEDMPAFGLVIVDQEEVWLGVYRGPGGALAGTLRNDSRPAVEWAMECFRRHKNPARAVFPL